MSECQELKEQVEELKMEKLSMCVGEYEKVRWKRGEWVEVSGRVR